MDNYGKRVEVKSKTEIVVARGSGGKEGEGTTEKKKLSYCFHKSFFKNTS